MTGATGDGRRATGGSDDTASAGTLNRREALKVLGVVPVAAAMGPAVAHAETAANAVQSAVVQATWIVSPSMT